MSAFPGEYRLYRMVYRTHVPMVYRTHVPSAPLRRWLDRRASARLIHSTEELTSAFKRLSLSMSVTIGMLETARPAGFPTGLAPTIGAEHLEQRDGTP